MRKGTTGKGTTGKGTTGKGTTRKTTTCKGTIFRIHGKTYCVGEKTTKIKKGKTVRLKRR
jgi:hypothetical protein